MGTRLLALRHPSQNCGISAPCGKLLINFSLMRIVPLNDMSSTMMSFPTLAKPFPKRTSSTILGLTLRAACLWVRSDKSFGVKETFHSMMTMSGGRCVSEARVELGNQAQLTIFRVRESPDMIDMRRLRSEGEGRHAKLRKMR